MCFCGSTAAGGLFVGDFVGADVGDVAGAFVGTFVAVFVGLLVGDLFGARRLRVLHLESVVFMERSLMLRWFLWSLIGDVWKM
jgi:hypothetical protein